MDKVLKQDVMEFASSFKLAKSLNRKRFLITGGTGLIGSILVRCLLALNEDVLIVLPVRNKAKAIKMFGGNEKFLKIVECDLIEFCQNYDESFDYIIHCASPTAGKYMTEHPIDTYTFAIDTTRALLEQTRYLDVKSMVYVSSLEYYGQNDNDKLITEEMQGYVENTNPRSAYPLGKRAAEYLCNMYASQFGVNVKCVRLTQTFGAGVKVSDNRVFAQFARSIIRGTDIVLHTKGESAKPYSYTTDSISAILYVLLKGRPGEAYNVANPETYISIKDMAQFLCKEFNPQIKVLLEEHPEMGYAPFTRLNLSVHKLMELGWQPKYSLKEMFKRLIASMKGC